MSLEETVHGMWKALSERDWDLLRTYLSEDCIYLDMPVGPAAAARGPEDIVKRLKIGLEPPASCENFRDCSCRTGATPCARASRGMALGQRRIRRAAVRHGASGRERQGDPVEGLLGHGGPGPTMPRRTGWRTSPPPACRGCSTPPGWSDGEVHRRSSVDTPRSRTGALPDPGTPERTPHQRHRRRGWRPAPQP